MRIKRVSDREEIEGIKNLQTVNLRKNLSPEETEAEGFVTAEYSLDFLERMNREAPAIIAVEDGKVVGYALVATRNLLGQHELLDDLFRQVDEQIYRGVKLSEKNYVLVGQLCVAKEQRGKGLAGKMYELFRAELSDQFDCCLTDVQVSNPRSIRAHLRSGFEILGELSYGGSPWKIVIWDWLSPEPSISRPSAG